MGKKATALYYYSVYIFFISEAIQFNIYYNDPPKIIED